MSPLLLQLLLQSLQPEHLPAIEGEVVDVELVEPQSLPEWMNPAK